MHIVEATKKIQEENSESIIIDQEIDSPEAMLFFGNALKTYATFNRNQKLKDIIFQKITISHEDFQKFSTAICSFRQYAPKLRIHFDNVTVESDPSNLTFMKTYVDVQQKNLQFTNEKASSIPAHVSKILLNERLLTMRRQHNEEDQTKISFKIKTLTLGTEEITKQTLEAHPNHLVSTLSPFLLIEIDLSNQNLNDMHLAKLSPFLECCTQLETINLTGNQLTHISIEVINTLIDKNPTIKTILVHENPGINTQEISKLDQQGRVFREKDTLNSREKSHSTGNQQENKKSEKTKYWLTESALPDNFFKKEKKKKKDKKDKKDKKTKRTVNNHP